MKCQPDSFLNHLPPQPLLNTNRYRAVPPAPLTPVIEGVVGAEVMVDDFKSTGYGTNSSTENRLSQGDDVFFCHNGGSLCGA